MLNSGQCGMAASLSEQGDCPEEHRTETALKEAATKGVGGIAPWRHAGDLQQRSRRFVHFTLSQDGSAQKENLMNRSLIPACAGLLSLVALSTHAQVGYENVLPKNLTPEAKKYRTLWLERTKGENLAKGVKVLLSLTPDWTNDEKNDPWKLTDGKLSTQNDDRIYVRPRRRWSAGITRLPAWA